MLNPKEANFFAEAKANGFDDETIAAEIKKRRTAAPAAGVDPRPVPAGGREVPPDPSPSGLIADNPTKVTTDQTQGVISEIKRGKPGEPLQAAENRASARRDANNPVKDDWIAQELISGAVIAPAVGLLGKGVKAVANKAIDRVATRNLDTMARGAPGSARKALGKTEAKELVKSEPSISGAKGDEGKIAALDDFIAKESTAQDVVYSKYAKPSAPPKPPQMETSKPNAFDEPGDIQYSHPERAALESDLAKRGVRLAPQNHGTVGDATVASGTPKAAAMDTTVSEVPGGVSVDSFATSVRTKIDKLRSGTNSQKETAKAMEGELETFLAGKDPNGVISPRDIRKQATDWQTAYDKTANNATNSAKKEMSKDALSALDAHITDPADLAAVHARNARISSATALRETLKKKLEIANAPGKPIKEGPGIVKSITSAPGKAVGGMVRGADQILAKIASASASGGDVPRLVEQALKIGVTQAAIDQTMQSTEKVKSGRK